MSCPTSRLSEETCAWGDHGEAHLEVLRSLTSVGGELSVSDTRELTSLSGLEQLATVGKLTVASNTSLTSLDGLGGLTAVGEGGLTILENDLLANLKPLAGLQSVAGAADITGNDAIGDLDGLQGLTRLASLRVSESDALTSLRGLDNLAEVTELLQIEGNPRLVDMRALGNLRAAHSLIVTDNPRLPTRLAHALVDRLTAEAATLTGGAAVSRNQPLPVLETEVDLQAGSAAVSVTLVASGPLYLAFEPLVLMRIVDLGEARDLARIEWQGDTPAGTAIEVRTRSGNAVDEVTRFFDSSLAEVTEDAYGRLPGASRGPVVTEIVPGNDWGEWSEAHSRTRSPLVADHTHRHVQLQVTLSSTDLAAEPALDSIVIHYN